MPRHRFKGYKTTIATYILCEGLPGQCRVILGECRQTFWPSQTSFETRSPCRLRFELSKRVFVSEIYNLLSHVYSEGGVEIVQSEDRSDHPTFEKPN